MKLRNPFIRRIARHLNVSTLFRRPDPAVDESTRRSVYSKVPGTGGAAPAVAVLLPESRMLSLPLGYAVGAPEILPPIPGEVSGADETQQTQERIQQAERYTQPAPRTVQTAPMVQKTSRPVVPPAIQTGPGDVPTDALSREWPRLQAIMRGHEAVQNTAIENSPAPAASPTAPATKTRIINPPSKPVVMEMDQDRGVRTPGSPATLASTPQQSAPVPQTPVQAKMESAGLTGEPETPSLASDDLIPEQTEPVSSSVPPTESPSSQVDLPPPPPSVGGLDDTVPGFHPADLTRQPAQSTTQKADLGGESKQTSPTAQPTAVAEPAARAVPTGAAPTLPPRQTAPEVAERKPLQEVWPVQRQADTQLTPAQITPMESEQFPAAEDANAMLPDLQQIRQIESALEGVAVSQPTDSQVELITPRRPRPGTPLQAKPVSQPADVPQSTLKTPAEKQEMPEGASPETVVHQTPAASAPQTGPVSSASTPAEPPQMVETEIGPLPADLWQLMGAEPPAGRVIPAGHPVETSVVHRAEQHPKSPTDQPSIFDEATLPAVEAETQYELPSTSPKGKTESVLRTITPRIQRTAQVGEVETEVSQEPSGGETNPSNGGQAADSTQAQGEQQQNAQLSPAAVDKLVREVYAQIKRRFSIERERLHKD